MFKFLLLQWDAWAPGVEDKDSWTKWANDEIEIEQSLATPPLEHMAKIKKRRLSQLTKMVLEVGHKLLENNDVDHIILCSRYGEIRMQYKITKGLLDDGEVKPSNFSLSVFNTPLSLLSIEEGKHGSVNILFAGDRIVSMGMQSMYAHAFCNPEDKILMIFADELLPEHYAPLTQAESSPGAFGFVVTPQVEELSVPQFDFSQNTNSSISDDVLPLDLLKWIINNENSTGSKCLKTSQIVLTFN
ncbi:MAG: beta-ketoacyl synthase chain length factor [Spirochaetales bacterium]|nr:beta-ketoacyl synthase chain length factor [Spirochaetales bacterium]